LIRSGFAIGIDETKKACVEFGTGFLHCLLEPVIRSVLRIMRTDCASLVDNPWTDHRMRVSQQYIQGLMDAIFQDR
jgi:hypothetical protein